MDNIRYPAARRGVVLYSKSRRLVIRQTYRLNRELTMNIPRLKELAIALEYQLLIHSKIDPEAVALHADLKPLLIQAKAGTLTNPLEVRDVPGRYRFTERNLQQYRDLENAFADFSIEARGGETPALKWLREQMK